MTKSIFKCVKCDKYTLNMEKCSSCGGRVVSPRPAKFSIEKEKKYSTYRRQLIKNNLNTS